MSISLLPEEVKEKRVKEVRLRTFRRTGFAFLIFIVLVSLGSFLYFQSLNTSLSRTNGEITSLEQKIEDLRAIEAIANDVEKRSEALRAIFTDEVYFSKLLGALAEATTQDVTILELAVPSGSSANLSGSTRSYASLANFLLALKGTAKQSPLFSKVALKEVSLDRQTGAIRFSVILGIHEEALKSENE